MAEIPIERRREFVSNLANIPLTSPDDPLYVSLDEAEPVRGRDGRVVCRSVPEHLRIDR